jgi:hypothetical protein
MVQSISLKNIKNIWVNGLLLVSSTVLVLLLGEFICRQVLEPVNYLRPTLLRDDILGHKIEPYSGKHDAWGFRNLYVPEQADIVAIGDSLTYGQNAVRHSSWPAILEKNIQLSSYNMGVPAYGPVEYYYLLKNKAFSLNPKLVITAISIGTDLMDAFNTVYARPYWIDLRNPDFNYRTKDRSDYVDNNKQKESKRFWKNLRNWLSKHSVLYNVFKNIFQKQIQEFQFQNNKQEDHENYVIRLEKDPNLTFDLNKSINLNLEDEKIREGMRISFQILLDMSLLCQQKGVQFWVILIPTKEIIYAEYIEHQSYLPHSETIDKFLDNQRKVIQAFQSFLGNHKIKYTDIGVYLRKFKEKHTLYPPHKEEHFNGEGYTVIGQILTELLKEDKKFLSNLN